MILPEICKNNFLKKNQKIFLQKIVKNFRMVGTRGLEPRTSSLSEKRSNQLSYAPEIFKILKKIFFSSNFLKKFCDFF